MDIGIYDITGKWVLNLIGKQMHSGKYNIVWKGDDMAGNPVASGPYLVMMMVVQFDKKNKVNKVIHIEIWISHIYKIFAFRMGDSFNKG